MHTYMITGSAPIERIVEQVVRALDSGVERVQVRRKGRPARELEELVAAIVERRCASRPSLLVNDRFDVAMAHELGGVHLPADGLDVASVRRFAPAAFTIGASVHGVDAARHAARSGADFVVYGPVFPTPSKPGHPGFGLEGLKRVVDAVAIPVFALGGMSAANAARVAEAGAFGVAGISTFANERALRELMACP